MLGTLKLDGPLVLGLALLAVYGQVVLYSASGQDWESVMRGSIRIGLGAVAMLALAQVKPAFLRRLSPWLYIARCRAAARSSTLIGYIGKGAQRWLDLGIIRFQPSEIMKLAVPMMCAWYLRERALPPDGKSLAVLVADHRGARGPHDPAAGPRHRAADHDGRRARDPARGPAVADHRRHGRGRRARRLGRLVPAARLPAPARADLPRPAGRSARLRATTSSSRRSRSARAACSARAT